VQRLLGIGLLVQILACAVVGTRLVLLSRRTREIPELALGCCFLLLGVVGHPLSVLARSGSGEGGLLVSALAAQDLASLAMYVATWRSFRPGDGWIGPAIGAIALAFAVSVAGQAATLGAGDERLAGAFYYLGFCLRALAFLWAAAESVHCARTARRRLALGLVDAVVADRFRLWAVATVCISLGFAIFLAGRLLTDNVAESPWVLASSSVVGVAGGVSMWLAFFPPPAYLRWVLAKA
jgi:hypothetical protein